MLRRGSGAGAVRTWPSSTPTSTAPCCAPARSAPGAGTSAIVRPSGAMRGARIPPGTFAISRGSEPSAAASPTTLTVWPPSLCRRRKTIRFPSGDQSPSVAPSSSRRASPPSTAAR